MHERYPIVIDPQGERLQPLDLIIPQLLPVMNCGLLRILRDHIPSAFEGDDLVVISQHTSRYVRSYEIDALGCVGAVPYYITKAVDLFDAAAFDVGQGGA